MKLRTCMAVSVLLVGLLCGCPKEKSPKAEPPPVAIKTLDQNKHLEILPGLSAQETIARLIKVAQDRPLSSEEHFNLALAYFYNRQIAEALTTAQLGLGTTKVPQEKAILYVIISETQGAMGNYQMAGNAALAGQRLDPNSKELACLRSDYFEKAGDKAQQLAARDHLRRIDPNFPDPVNVAGFVRKWGPAILVILKIGRDEWLKIEPYVSELVTQLKDDWARMRPVVKAMVEQLKDDFPKLKDALKNPNAVSK